MIDYEKLGLFYLGRRHDLERGTSFDEPLLYDSRDLVTHAVCVGMTGSGKTGLGLALIEEAAIDGVPVLAVDPKGDLGNLLLTFPGLTGAEFRPWIDEDEARRAGLAPEDFAAAEAAKWRQGLADWGQDGARIERLRRAADFRIYTPGSRAGLPVSILKSFSAPPPGVRDDREALAERAGYTATSLLGLAGVDAPPRSREHTLLATVLAGAWREGRDLDLATLIPLVQSPPFPKIGVLDLESFYPQKDRFELAMRLNGLLAAPGFDQWLEGTPLEPASLLYTPEGRPRVAIVSIAHLGDAERMFVVSLLFNQIVAWMRMQTGTSSLRALVYMDEIVGYFPPVAAPPSKGPLLTLLKQGRAFGVGVVLATQNPVDLDYKGLSNTGTWFLGRLQTERDKSRVLEGLEGVAGGIDRAEADRLLSALGKRVFLLHNVHEPGPVLFQTRWTLSYLRGPLSRDQIRALTLETGVVPSEAAAPAAGSAAPSVAPAVASVAPAQQAEIPIVPPGIEQFFVPIAATGSTSPVTYRPVVLGAARVGFTDGKLRVNESRDVLYAAPLTADAVALDWAKATRLALETADLQRAGVPGAAYQPIPEAGLRARSYGLWEKSLSKWLAQAEQLELLRHPTVGLVSKPGEAERDFRIRVQDAQRAARDEALAALRRKYAPRLAQLEEQGRRAEAALERETDQASQARLQTAVSMGATLLGAILGRKAVSTGTIGRATTAARGVGRSMKEAGDIKHAEETVEAVRERQRQLEEELARETARIASEYESATRFETVALAPRRGQVSIQFVGLGWMAG
ncbi:MAG TPA: hypothetical protein VD833_09710 [Vicinamibacterales bacterium]|nr:hypothetical protein [Vicinamibacterales bacterium]